MVGTGDRQWMAVVGTVYGQWMDGRGTVDGEWIDSGMDSATDDGSDSG